MPPSRTRLLLAFAAVYVLWGSTYLFIRFALESMPPLLMAGVRHTAAGIPLYVYARRAGASAPRRSQWRPAFLIGGLMLLGGNGAVCWAEQHVPSGLAALLIATVPLWLVLLQGRHPGGRILLGLALGMAGLAILVGPESLVGAGRIDPLGAGVLLGGAFSWALGSLRSRTADLPPSPLLATAMQMLGGGLLLLLAGLALGEGARFDPAGVSAKAALSLLYLVVFGSLVAYTAYVWLLRVTTPARVGTYAYVNPAVAVFLGWAFAGEPITPRVLLASAVIVGAVALIVTARADRSRPRGDR